MKKASLPVNSIEKAPARPECYAGTPDRTTKAARLYVSPRTRPLNAFEMETRGLSYLLKDAQCPEQAIHVAAREMAALV